MDKKKLKRKACDGTDFVHVKVRRKKKNLAPEEIVGRKFMNTTKFFRSLLIMFGPLHYGKS